MSHNTNKSHLGISMPRLILGGGEIGRHTAAKAVDWPWKSAMGRESLRDPLSVRVRPLQNNQG